MVKKQFLIAHRGYSAIAPENTKLAFDAALLFGFDGFELDLHLTKDGQIVIIHDETTNRTALVKKKVGKTLLKDLKKDDHGIFFKMNLPKQSIMTLKEFLDLYFDKVKFINLEVKTDLIHYPQIEQKIYDLISKYPKFRSRIVLSSFNFKSLEILYKLDSKLKLGFLWSTHANFKKIDKKKISKICKYLNPKAIVYDKHKLEYQKFAKPFCLWTLKSIQKFKKYQKDQHVVVQISNYKY